jgi:hypothetical protein
LQRLQRVGHVLERGQHRLLPVGHGLVETGPGSALPVQQLTAVEKRLGQVQPQ